jgi:hypothetical protein
MHTQFTFNSSEFKNLISEVRKLSPRSLKMNVPISIQPYRIEFLFVGISRLLPSSTNNFCDVVIPFRILEAIAKTADTQVITLKVEQGKIEYGKMKITSVNIHIQSLFNNRDSQIPINITPMVLLGLRQKHSEAFLKSKGYLSLIRTEEDRLDRNLKAAVKKLKDYGVTYHILREWILKQQ